MKNPCQHNPLAVCDPNSVKKSNIVPSGLFGFYESGEPSRSLMMKRDEDTKWYYYPDMTNDEVLVFKQYEFFKGVDDKEEEPFKTCYHTSFKHPDTPHFVEERTNCEHRIGIFFG